MNKTSRSFAALLCAVLILLSVFTNTGLTVRAQAIDYLNTVEPKGVLKDSGGSTYSAVTDSAAVTGKSGAVYNNGIRVLLARDGDDGASFVTLTYEVKNNAAVFAGYVDLDKTSENDSNFAVKLEVFSGETAVYTQTLTASTQFPVKVEAPITGAKEITVRMGDTAQNEKKTAFVIGNAAICESGATIPAVTVPEQNGNTNQNNQNNQGTSSTTDLSADAQELKSKSKEYMGHNYLYVTMQLSWTQAATWCEMQGGYLATIGSETENKFVADYLRSLGNKTAYLGMSNDNADKDFRWQNGETALYFRWARQTAIIDGTAYMMMGGGTDEWNVGKADSDYLSFVIEWGEKAPLSENNNAKPEKAVIIIPGLGGSQLSDTDTDAVWAKKSGIYTELSLSNVSANKTGITAANSEYGVSDTYKGLMEEAEKVCSDSDIVLYEWDWRNSAADGAKGLKTLIEDGGWSEVTLIGHNTGGLAACYYISENGADSVSRLITLGTPFYGTEKAFFMMKSGMFAQGAYAVRGSLNTGTASLPALYSLVPEEPQAGAESFTGKLTDRLSRSEVLTAAGAQSTHVKGTDSAQLKKVYELIESGEFGNAYIVAGTGKPTIESVVLTDGEITKINTSFDGDGLTNLKSAAMNFKSARPPYILENTDTVELVTNEDSIRFICNILSGGADTSDYADGVTREVYRNEQKAEERPVEITLCGNAKLTVQTQDQTIMLSEKGFSFSGNAQEGFVYGKSIQSVRTSDKAAQINIEILGSGVDLEIRDGSSIRRWTDIDIAPGAVLKAQANSKVIQVFSDPGNSGVKEIEQDPMPEMEAEAETDTEEETDEEERATIPWNIWVAIGLTVGAAAVAMILMPYFAYRVSKVETDRKKRLLKQSLRQRRQQAMGAADQTGNAQQGYQQNFPMMPPMQDGSVPFDVENPLGGDPAIDYEIMNSNR